ncbi:MAG: SDR family oxidoreductase [Dehalococcoidia bacterium]
MGVNPKTVVVTGGAGFIGSHLAEELLRRGYNVAVLDDLSTGKPENIAHLLNPTNSTNPTNSINSPVEFIDGSITDLPLLKKHFRDVDYVFHQAAIPSVPRSIADPRASHEANITGTLNVLLAARDSGVKKVIYASSCAVYGDTPTLPVTEDMLPAPQSPYAVTKLAGEYYCQVFHRVYGLPTVCLRYFNVYGPGQDPHSQYAAVIPLFIREALDNRPPIIYDDGEQTRDFIFIKDVVDANILAAESDAAGVCNIGRGQRVSINRLAGLVIRLVGSSVEPEHREARPGDVRHSLADISRAGQFGYSPKYSLKKGLGETIQAIQICYSEYLPQFRREFSP